MADGEVEGDGDVEGEGEEEGEGEVEGEGEGEQLLPLPLPLQLLAARSRFRLLEEKLVLLGELLRVESVLVAPTEVCPYSTMRRTKIIQRILYAIFLEWLL